jgi:hypothetical protein
MTLGNRTIDRRTAMGRELARWRGDLVRDLGGEDVLTTQQAAIVGLAVKTKLILDSVDAWLLAQPTLVNVRKRALLPVVRERQALADALARYMTMLGLERKAKPLRSIAELVAGEKVGAQSSTPFQPSRRGDSEPPTVQPTVQPVAGEPSTPFRSSPGDSGAGAP